MSNPNKQKGTAWETELSKYLDCKRIGSVNGSNDKGDLYDPDWVLEAKAEKSIDLPGYMRQVDRELNNADNQTWGIALVKKRYSKVGEGYAVMPIWQFRALRDYIRHLEGDDSPITPYSGYPYSDNEEI